MKIFIEKFCFNEKLHYLCTRNLLKTSFKLVYAANIQIIFEICQYGRRKSSKCHPKT